MRNFYRENWDYIDLLIVAALAFTVLSLGIAIFA